MTFEEAKKIFLNRGYVEVPGGTYYDADKWREAVTVISKWLEQEPCEDVVRRQAVLNTLDKMDKALDEDRTVENYKELLTECYKDLIPVIPKEEIIHCKDCKYRDYWGDCNKWSKGLDAHKTYLLDENMFCGFAERKE